MKPEEMLLKKEEQVSFSLRALFEQYGYRKFKMSKFEEYDFYAENRSFLHSEAILTFTGLDGKLLALKPDVTLSIVKNTKGSRDTAERVYYNENVYRARKGAGEYKEIMQVGLEYIGEVDAYAAGGAFTGEEKPESHQRRLHTGCFPHGLCGRADGGGCFALCTAG